jgi:membrane-anchored mycosin MYCP
VTHRRIAFLGLLPAAALLGVAAPATAGGVPDCEQTTENVVAQASHQQSQPLRLLSIAKAQGLVARPGHVPGSGVNVAVVDSGIKPGSQIPVVASYSVNGPSVKVASYHGTAVAGLVAGHARAGGLLTGVAPGSGIVDVQTWGWPKGTAGQPALPSTETLVGGLTWLTKHARALHVKVAVVPDAYQPIPAAATAVKALQATGVLVVASAGNRPVDQSPGYLSQYFHDRPGQDGFADIAPARYPGVVTAGTTAAGGSPSSDPTSIPNSAVDVVVPTAHGISVALNGGDCLLTAPSTSWAAGEVAGIAALLFDRYAGDSPAQVAARMTDTASGTSPDGHGALAKGDASLYFGSGVVQPVDALTRPLTSGRGGVFSHLVAQPEPTPRVRAPLAQADLLHRSRHVAIWAGLLGGAVVVAASILRPLVTRRRRTGRTGRA